MYSCRICFEDTTNREEIINPCNCKGSSKYVHKNCINQWFKFNLSNKNYDICNSCLSKYNRKTENDISMTKMIDRKFFTNELIILITFFVFFFIITLLVSIFPSFGNFIILMFIWIVWISLILIEVGWIGLIVFIALSTAFQNIYQEKTKSKSLSVLLIGLIFTFYCIHPFIYEYSISSIKSTFRKDNTFLMYDYELKKYVSGVL